METVQVTLRDDVWRELDWGGVPLLFLLSLTAAFNMVKHDQLAHNLANEGVWGSALKWLSCFSMFEDRVWHLGESYLSETAGMQYAAGNNSLPDIA